MFKKFTGRGSNLNPGSRFDSILRTDLNPFEKEKTKRIEIKDSSRSIVARNESPDIPFSQSINPYRGCEHGCIYCYARPSHNYFDLSSGIDFETQIFWKENATELLRKEFSRKKYAVSPLALSGVTDCYQPIEKERKVTQSILETLLEYEHPVTILTKNSLIRRDADLLARLAEKNLVLVAFSLSSLKAEITGKLEPHASPPSARLNAMHELSSLGIPVGIMTAPLIPFLNDNELETVLTSARESGASFAGYTILRLPHDVKEIFIEFLQREFPEKTERILARLREIQGDDYASKPFFNRMFGKGEYAKLLAHRFQVATKRLGYGTIPKLDLSRFTKPGTEYSLFP